MESIFRSSWEDLSLDDVEAFLAEAGDEGLTWEAKGADRPHPGSVRKNVAGFANSIGGFFLLGVDREADGTWHVNGIAFGDGVEPTTWLGNIIRNGMRPVPRYDIKTWETGAGHVAIVNVDTVPDAPCMTSSGEIFERVSGETVRVDDPGVLRRLYERGAAAEAAAEDGALSIADRAYELPPEGSHFGINLGMSPIGHATPDIASRLFTPSFEARLRETYEALPTAPLFPYPSEGAYRVKMGAAMFSAIPLGDDRQRWTVTARWDGSVGAFFDLFPEADDNPALTSGAIFEEGVAPAVTAATALVSALGGYGRAYVSLFITGRNFSIVHNAFRERIPGAARARTWTAPDGTLNEEAIERVKREILRACSIATYEPDVED